MIIDQNGKKTPLCAGMTIRWCRASEAFQVGLEDGRVLHWCHHDDIDDKFLVGPLDDLSAMRVLRLIGHACGLNYKIVETSLGEPVAIYTK